jgi:hypothetical protein
MGNNLQISQEISAPAHQNREQALLLHTYTSRLEVHPGAAKSSISSQLAPTPEDRQRLEARRRTLSNGLAPIGNVAEAGVLIGQMFAGYATVRLTEEQAASTVAAYLDQVRHLPLWAVQTGCRACVARNNPFPPSAGELRAACEKAVQPIRDEEAEIRKVLEAEVYHSRPEEERERVIAGFKALLPQIELNSSMEPPLRIGQKFTRPVNGTATQLSEHALTAFNAKSPPSYVEGE